MGKYLSLKEQAENSVELWREWHGTVGTVPASWTVSSALFCSF